MGMTEQEAIKKHIEECRDRIDVIQAYMKTNNSDTNIKRCGRNIFILESTIKTLEKQSERLDELEGLQNPLEVDAILLHNGKTGYQCKNCGNELAVNKFNGEYCNWCGQKLSWGNEDAE